MGMVVPGSLCLTPHEWGGARVRDRMPQGTQQGSQAGCESRLCHCRSRCQPACMQPCVGDGALPAWTRPLGPSEEHY